MTFEEWIQLKRSEKIYLYRLNIANASGDMDLHLSTRAYYDGTHLYLPMEKRTPFFKRSLQDVVYGSSMTSFGYALFVTADGRLDTYLENYNFTGREIEVKLGGSEIDYSEFRTVLKGVMDKVTVDDLTLKVPVLDKQGLLLRRMTPSGTYHDRIATVIHTILNAIGIDDTQIDLASLSQFDADYPYTVYYVVSGAESARTTFDALLSPMLCWYGFNRAGLFQVGGFSSPGTTAAMAFTRDLELIDWKEEVFHKQYWKVKVSYISDTTTTPPTRTEVSQQDSTIQDLYPLAMESGTKETYLAAAADANAILSDWWDLLSAQRRVATVTVKVQPMALELGDVIRIQRDRFNLDAYYRILSIEENYDKNTVKLGLFR